MRALRPQTAAACKFRAYKKSGPEEEPLLNYIERMHFLRIIIFLRIKAAIIDFFIQSLHMGSSRCCHPKKYGRATTAFQR